MKYSVCTQVKMKCPVCEVIYDITINDKQYMDTIKVLCECGKELNSNDHEVNTYGAKE